MITYRVLITPEAEQGVLDAFRYIDERAPISAERWLRKLYRRIDTLERMPRRCALAPESDYFGEELRQLIFESHRIVFRIEDAAGIVRVLFVVHGKQRHRSLGAND